MNKRIRIIIIGILLFTIAVILIIGTYFYNQSVKRGSEVELHKEEVTVILDVDEKSQSLLEDAKSWYSSEERVRLTEESYDRLTLQADFIENEENFKKAVILVHGFRKGKEDMGDYAKFYYDEGYDILMPDSRGHGDSQGDYYGYGWHDRLDIMMWIERLVEEYGEEKIVLHGNSAGAATVLMTSGEELPPEVKAIIADSGYTTMKEELAHQLKSIYGLPSFPLLSITSGITKLRAGYFFGEVSSVEQVKNNKLPLFIIHGDADELVPTWMGQEIYDVASGDKQLWIVPGVGHIDAYKMKTAEFEERLRDFLKKIED